MSMEVGRAICSSGFGKPPWIFKGSALYQLHLVKAETARAVIPKELKLVEAFGYTLGGFFLASYDDSPMGVFDELVVLAGIVWNQPSQKRKGNIWIREPICAWAARTLVNSEEACDHGREEFGLPSQVARFSKRFTAIPRKPKNRFSDFLNMITAGITFCGTKDHMDVQVTEIRGSAATDICNINFTVGPALKFYKWMAPTIKMSLPSFSGRTEYNPDLLKYSCEFKTRLRVVQLAKVSGPSLAPKNDKDQSSKQQTGDTMDSTTGELVDNGRDLRISEMLSKPLVALELSCMKMQVEAPIVVSHCSKNSFGRS